MMTNAETAGPRVRGGNRGGRHPCRPLPQAGLADGTRRYPLCPYPLAFFRYEIFNLHLLYPFHSLWYRAVAVLRIRNEPRHACARGTGLPDGRRRPEYLPVL